MGKKDFWDDKGFWDECHDKKKKKRKKCCPCISNDPVQKQEVNIKIVVVDKEEE